MHAARAFLMLFILLHPTVLGARPRSITQAITALEQGDAPQAQALIDQATQEPSLQNLPCTWYYRGVIYEKLLREQITTEQAANCLKHTLAAYRKVLALTSRYTQYHSFAKANLYGLWAYYLDWGRRSYRREAFEDAITQLAIARDIRPQDPRAYLYIGVAAHQNADYDLAWSNYEQYLALGAKDPAVYRGMACIAFTQHHNPVQARAILAQALTQYPWDHGLLQEQVEQHKALGSMADWMSALQQQIVEAPRKAIYPYYLGYVCEQQGEYLKALEYYQKASKLAPREAALWQQQGLMHYQQAAESAQRINEMPPEAFQQVGRVHLSVYKEHLNQAKRCLKKASALQPYSLLLLECLRHVYDRLQMPASAKAVQQRMRRLRQ